MTGYQDNTLSCYQQSLTNLVPGRGDAMLISEEEIERIRTALLRPGHQARTEDVIALVNAALAAHRFRSVLKHGVMVQNLKDKGLSHTNHYQQIEAEFWHEAREAVAKRAKSDTIETLINDTLKGEL
jgi:hypothetical protein